MKHIVGIADMKVIQEPGDTIVTYALGSCLGIIIYDPVARVGGMLHVMLPLSSMDPVKAEGKPCMFVDTGVALLFREAYAAGAAKNRLIVKVAGGASIQHNVGSQLDIGKRNYIVLKKLLWKNGVLIKAEDVGGEGARTVSFDLDSGQVLVRSGSESSEL